MNTDDMVINHRKTCGYEGCSNDNTADAAKTFGDVSYDAKISWVLSMDCTHLLPCGKCDLSNEDCPENTRRTTHPVYPTYPYVPDYPRPYNPWRPVPDYTPWGPYRWIPDYSKPWPPGTIICSYELK